MVEVGALIAVVGDAASASAAPPRPPPRRRRRPAAAAPPRTPEAEQPPPSRRRPRPSRRSRPRRRAGRRPAPRRRPAPAAPRPRPSAPASNGANRLLSPVVRRLVNEHGLRPRGHPRHRPRRAHHPRRRRQPHRARRAGGAGRGPGRRPRRRPRRPPRRRGARRAGSGRARRGGAGAGARRPAGGRPGGPRRPARREREALQDPHASPATTCSCRWPPAPTPSAWWRSTTPTSTRSATPIKDEWKGAEGFSLTYLPFISRAVIDAFAEFPHLNATRGRRRARSCTSSSTSASPSTSNYQGLLVPVIRDADTKRLRAIAREIVDLAGRAKSRQACRPTRSRAAPSPSPTTARPARC